MGGTLFDPLLVREATTMPETTPSLHTVFVSHAHADNELCDRYVAALRERGLDVWYDRTNMQDGHFLSEQIAMELERRNAFVVLLTPASVASFWVRLEIQAYLDLLAHDTARLLLPVHVADCVVPTLLRAFKWIDALSLGLDASVDAMAVALGAPTPTPQPTESVEELLAQGMSLLAQGGELQAQEKWDEAHPWHAEAIRLLERATKLDPRSFLAWASLGVAYFGVDRLDDAFTAFDRALAQYEIWAGVWEPNGTLLNVQERRDKALVALDRALVLSPNIGFSISVLVVKWRILLRWARFAEAEEARKRANKLRGLG
jgi:tetratricopeptide (TPR) repeat protein